MNTFIHSIESLPADTQTFVVALALGAAAAGFLMGRSLRLFAVAVLFSVLIVLTGNPNSLSTVSEAVIKLLLQQ